MRKNLSALEWKFCFLAGALFFFVFNCSIPFGVWDPVYEELPAPARVIEGVLSSFFTRSKVGSHRSVPCACGV